MKDHKKKSRIVPGEYLIAAIFAAVIVFGVWMAMRADTGKRKSVEGTYSCEYPINGSQDKSITVYYKFDAEEGTFEELWGERTLLTGSYTVEGDTLTLVTDEKEDIGAKSETITFLIQDGLLLDRQYLYEGSLPPDDTFDAECTMTDFAGQEYIVRFAKDGSYTYTIKALSADGDDKVMKGTYEREGDLIHRTNADGGPMTDFYVYDGRLAGIFYTKE